MYSDMRLLARNISDERKARSTVKALQMRTSSFTHTCDSKLSPMAISHVVGKPTSSNSLLRKAESSTISRWLLTKV